MSNIGPVSQVNPATNPQALSRQPGTRDIKPQDERPTDRVDLSDSAKLTADPDVRSDLVARVKAEIAAGTYETDDRITAAVRAVADRLANPA